MKITTSTVLIKNITFLEPHVLVDLVDYGEGRVVGRTLSQNKGVSMTLFAFDVGEGLSTHSASGDAMVQVLDGAAEINIGGKEIVVRIGEVVVTPVDVPHSLDARVPFKMILTVVKKSKD